MAVSEINGHEITQLDVEAQIGDRTNCSVGAFLTMNVLEFFPLRVLPKVCLKRKPSSSGRVNTSLVKILPKSDALSPAKNSSQKKARSLA